MAKATCFVESILDHSSLVVPSFQGMIVDRVVSVKKDFGSSVFVSELRSGSRRDLFRKGLRHSTTRLPSLATSRIQLMPEDRHPKSRTVPWAILLLVNEETQSAFF